MSLNSRSLRVAIAACVPVVQAADPVLSSGSATWETIETETGTKTIFTISDDSVFDWGDFNLDQGSELVFDFIGGNQVLNYLNGGGSYFLNGTVTSNGSVSFFAPGGNLFVGGSITAKSVTLASLNANPADVLDGNGYTLDGSLGSGILKVDGFVNATDGDIMLGGQQLIVGRRGELTATGAVRMAGTDRIKVSASGNQRLKDAGEEGFVLYQGTTHASQIDIRAGKEVHNVGTLDAQTGRIFIEVGGDGRVFSDNRAIIVGEMAFKGVIEQAPRANFDEADAPAVVSDSILKVPTLRRPDGTRITTASAVRTSNAVSASSSVTQPNPTRNVAAPVKKALMARSSFFGMRGTRGGSSSDEQKKTARR
ncbi:hypothetical protein HNR46_000262 [Haloferula luteola]|uniref:Uncharacterized protein n=1 Tax=Haloferula luteola TaxID=595692 RepID=A0A840VAW7_9BACT|nr:hypothetical protein [Haloferula luteola]MBB5350041.1 hypothetical protein [Haloferula luteola]